MYADVQKRFLEVVHLADQSRSDDGASETGSVKVFDGATVADLVLQSVALSQLALPTLNTSQESVAEALKLAHQAICALCTMVRQAHVAHTGIGASPCFHQ